MTRNLKPSSLTHLVLDDNNLTLSGVDEAIKSEKVYLRNLTYLSLRGNPIRKLERFVFHPLRESSLTKLNLQKCKLVAVNHDVFRSLSVVEQIDLYDNPSR